MTENLIPTVWNNLNESEVVLETAGRFCKTNSVPSDTFTHNPNYSGHLEDGDELVRRQDAEQMLEEMLRDFRDGVEAERVRIYDLIDQKISEIEKRDDSESLPNRAVRLELRRLRREIREEEK